MINNSWKILEKAKAQFRLSFMTGKFTHRQWKQRLMFSVEVTSKSNSSF